MTRQVTLTLLDETYNRAEWLAQLTSRRVADILADTIELSLPPLRKPPSATPVTQLSDQEVLALSEMQMEQDKDRRLSLLLDKQQAGQLTDLERPELLALMQLYQEQLLRKAQGLAESVRRGLREPLRP